MTKLHFYVASTYGSCSYNGNNYNDSCATTAGATGSSGSSAGGSTLTNTGVDVALFIGIAALLLLATMVVWLWKRPTTHSGGKQ